MGQEASPQGATAMREPAPAPAEPCRGAPARERGELLRRYPAIARFERDVGLPAEQMAEAFELEREFHRAVLAEPAPERRRALAEAMYARLAVIYGWQTRIPEDTGSSPRDPLVRVLLPELRGKAILDVGCGAGGDFLFACSRLAEPERLVGVDAAVTPMELPERRLRFVRGDVVEFTLPDPPFDVAMSDNVYEHVAPQDVPRHLDSIRRALKPGGTLVLLTPNRHFGPWDVTRILDDSYSGRTPAQGTHVNETTYAELLPRLADSGFGRFRSLWPTARSRGQRPGARVPSRLFALAERIGPLLRRLQALDKRARLTEFEVSVIATRVR